MQEPETFHRQKSLPVSAFPVFPLSLSYDVPTDPPDNATSEFSGYLPVRCPLFQEQRLGFRCRQSLSLVRRHVRLQ